MKLNRQIVICIILAMMSGLLVGCQSLKKPESKKSQANEMYKLIEKQRQEIAALKEENIILKSVPPKKHAKTSEPKSKVLLEKYKMFSDKKIYEKALRAYHEQSFNKLHEYIILLKSRDEESAFLDNVEALKAQLYMDKGQFAKAITAYNSVIRLYPQSEVRSRAILQKGFAYKVLNLKNYAEKTFKNLVVNYPGSPETARAKLELKLLYNTKFDKM